MSYTGKANTSFAGQHVTPSGGRAFVVYYLGNSERKAINRARTAAGLPVYPRGHRHRIKSGWYWITLADQADVKHTARVGPFTSSGGAYRAAIEKLDHGKG